MKPAEIVVVGKPLKVLTLTLICLLRSLTSWKEYNAGLFACCYGRLAFTVYYYKRLNFTVYYYRTLTFTV